MTYCSNVLLISLFAFYGYKHVENLILIQKIYKFIKKCKQLKITDIKFFYLLSEIQQKPVLFKTCWNDFLKGKPTFCMTYNKASQCIAK